MYPQDEEFHQRHIAEYVKQNIQALAGMPPSLYNRAARFFFYCVPCSIFNWSMRCDFTTSTLQEVQDAAALLHIGEDFVEPAL